MSMEAMFKELLAKVAAKEMSQEDALSQVSAMMPQHQAGKAPPITYKVSDKAKVLSIYGTRIRGVHLYAAEYLKIINDAAKGLAFIKTNKDTLAWKEGQEEALLGE